MLKIVFDEPEEKPLLVIKFSESEEQGGQKQTEDLGEQLEELAEQAAGERIEAALSRKMGRKAEKPAEPKGEQPATKQPEPEPVDIQEVLASIAAELEEKPKK